MTQDSGRTGQSNGGRKSHRKYNMRDSRRKITQNSDTEICSKLYYPIRKDQMVERIKKSIAIANTSVRHK